MTIAEAILYASGKLTAAGIPTARLDAEVLLSDILKKDRVWLIAHDNDTLAGAGQTLFEDAINRRSRREPLQYITGKQEFWGLDFQVTPDVLIPRPETELIVERAIGFVKKAGSQPTILDLCTGSGCIAISLAKELGDTRIFAVDTSSRALAVARGNARKHGVSDRIRFLEGDLFEPLGELDLRGRVDVITANPPYIRSDDLPRLQPEVRDYEPEIALRAGPDGTEIQHRIVENAPGFLKKNGVLIMEMGMGQAPALKTMVENTGSYAAIEIFKDLAGIERVIVAHKK
jgi:release factor glutamine methyltransferase